MNATRETWKPVVGYEGAYEVSDHGRVRTVPRIVMRRDGKPYPVAAKMRKASPNHKGYLKVTLVQDAKLRTRVIHTLVLEAFVGSMPEPGMECRHLNGDQTDNRLSNLAWGTPLENAADVRRHGTHFSSRKTECPRGHALSGANLFVDAKGKRTCRACKHEHKRSYEQRRDFDIENANRAYQRIRDREVRGILPPPRKTIKTTQNMEATA